MVFMTTLVDCSDNRHSDEMIQRLEKAGLGFYVRASETKQRLGVRPQNVSLDSKYFNILCYIYRMYSPS